MASGFAVTDKETIESIFIDAVEMPPDERRVFLDDRCGDDPALRAAVEQLIAADQGAGDGEFLRSALFGKDLAESAGEGGLEGGAAPADASGDAERFRVIRAYRQGGLGEVLLAHDRQLDRDVAVKQIKPRWKDSLEARQRFVQEAKVTGRLEHPGIVPVYAMGAWSDGQHYYAMRFIEGDTMKDVIAKYHLPALENADGSKQDAADAKRLQLRDLLTRFVDVCNTIQYAHSKQVLHRDIKPSNIMVGPYGETLVVDWGLAKLLDEPSEESMTADLVRALGESSGSTPTQVGGTIGTPQYMSPEQAKGKLDSIGTRTDVYLLGATLYQILTGQPPHKEDSIEKLLKRISQGHLTRPREITRDVAPALESICLKAMAKDPVNRYGNPIEIADDVNRWMADQPVSVHRDRAFVRINRWMRTHRTATSTLAVATVLLLVGGVLGSILWNVAKVREFQADQARRSKQLELEIKDRQRIAELAIAATAAENLAQKEIDRDRFSSAFDVLSNTLSSIKSEPGLGDQATRIRDKVNRVGALVEFYRLADVVEQQNVLSRDTKALLACTTALKKLGIWDRVDWWTALPDQDLSPQQIDTLRWDVYQQLMLMDAMLVKAIGVRLTGEGRLGGTVGMWRTAGRMLTTNAGKAEAEAVLIVSDRLDRFRLSESTRFYRSIAKMRLGTGTRLQGNQLGETRNSADAHSLAVLSMIASIDPSFEMIFRGYQREDSLLTARELFDRSASLRPKYYGAHLGLGQVEFMIAQRTQAQRTQAHGNQSDLRWEDLQDSVRAFGQCITLLPERCFAYADRSSIYRVQAKLISQDDRYSETQKQQRVAERLQWSLEDAGRAMESYQVHPWVGWQVGQTYADLGQLGRAMDLWIKTAIDTYPLAEIADTTFVGIDDLRGRAEIGDWLDERVNQAQSESDVDLAIANVALAGVRLNQARHDEAVRAIESALAIQGDHLDARAMRGIILLGEGSVRAAEADFQAVFHADREHPMAAFGLANCLEHDGRYAEALSMFQIAETLSLSGENQAAAALGRCRTAALSGDLISAKLAIQRAIDVEPACDLLSAARPLVIALNDRRELATLNEDQSVALEDFIKWIAQLPRATKIDPMPVAGADQKFAASVLNGDFELPSMRYWNAPSGALWETASDFDSSANVTDQVSHSGNHSLQIVASQPLGADPFGQTGQRFSVVAGLPYELACWVKADSLSPGSMSVNGPQNSELIKFDGGSYPWRRVTGTLRVTEDSNGEPVAAGTVVPCQVQIVARGSGTIWIDDISCHSVVENR